ncbi:MAG: J domain-containing protein [Planctomycetales bacterium]|nr:J domain-containing protein [Planctomycetales bacterium]
MQPNWPDKTDVAVTLVLLSVIIVLPLLGYWLTILDIRRYLRALRGVLMVVSQVRYRVPAWSQRETPNCLRAFGLQLPCNEHELKEAYRRRAKELHPDRGGDIHKFLTLQQQFEQAQHFLRNHS